jgi:hypothetical protein
MGTLESMHTGEQIIIGGLFVQLIFFGLFIAVSGVFHYRLVRDLPLKKRYGPSSLFKSRQSRPIAQTSSTVSRASLNDLPWKRHLFNLYFASALIMVRSIFRVAEYIGGNAGYLLSHEVYLYIFDAMLMLFVMVSFNWAHPSQVTDAHQKRLRSGSPLELRESHDVASGADEEQMLGHRDAKNGARAGGWSVSRG